MVKRLIVLVPLGVVLAVVPIFHVHGAVVWILFGLAVIWIVGLSALFINPREEEKSHLSAKPRPGSPS
jgi:hypothetical protein